MISWRFLVPQAGVPSFHAASNALSHIICKLFKSQPAHGAAPTVFILPGMPLGPASPLSQSRASELLPEPHSKPASGFLLAALRLPSLEANTREKGGLEGQMTLCLSLSSSISWTCSLFNLLSSTFPFLAAPVSIIFSNSFHPAKVSYTEITHLWLINFVSFDGHSIWLQSEITHSHPLLNIITPVTFFN